MVAPLTEAVLQALEQLGFAGAPVYDWQELADGTLEIRVPGSVAPLRHKPGKSLSPAPREADKGGGSTPSTPSTPSTIDDFTCIPYIGKEIAQALHNAGLRTFEDLVKAPDTRLLDVPHISAYTLKKIREYLQKHYL